jgi:gluconolactonase
MLAGAGAVTAALGADRALAAPEFNRSLRFPDPAIEVLDPRFTPYLVATSAVERLATGFRWAEGPAWFGDFGTLVFSDVQSNTLHRWDEQTGQVSALRKPSNHSNGNARDRQGRLLTCEHQTARVTRTEYDGTITVLADAFEGKALNSPNDIVCKRDGSIWFTDPGFGPMIIEGSRAPTGPGRVFRLDPATRRLTVIDDTLRGPNGLVFSPDERLLYVIEARSVPSRIIHVYDVSPDGLRATNRRQFHVAPVGATPDGLRVDIDGNLWCGWGMGEAFDGVLVLAPGDAKPLGRIRLPERCANLCFGGLSRNRLLMTASTSLYSLMLNTQGAPLN